MSSKSVGLNLNPSGKDSMANKKKKNTPAGNSNQQQQNRRETRTISVALCLYSRYYKIITTNKSLVWKKRKHESGFPFSSSPWIFLQSHRPTHHTTTKKEKRKNGTKTSYFPR